MAKAIGPSFLDELKAAGVTLNGWTWGKDGTFYFNSLPDSVKAQIQAVYDAHDPVAAAPKTKREILKDRIQDAIDADPITFRQKAVAMFQLLKDVL